MLRRPPLTGTSFALLVIASFEGAAAAGWPPALPSTWALVTVAVAARLAGAAAGGWAACVFAGYAACTAGFTFGHASDLLVLGRPSARVATFCAAAFALAGLVGSPAPLAADKRPGEHDVGSEALQPRFADVHALTDLRARTRSAVNDLNNRLFVVRGACEIVQGEARADARSPELVMAIDAVDECACVTAQLVSAIEKDVRATSADLIASETQATLARS
jgi:hypothetical protein